MWEREIEIAAGTPVIYVKDLDVKSKIKESGASLKEKGVEVRNGYFKGGSFSLNADFTVENPEELERFILEATYGKQINAIVEKLNGEWRSKFYKL